MQKLLMDSSLGNGKKEGEEMATTSYYSCSTINNGQSYVLPVTPGSFSLGASSNFAEQNMLGRGHPLSAYVNSGSRSFSFSFTVHRDMWGSEKIQGSLSGSDGYSTLDTLLVHFQKMVLPSYKSNTIIPPITRFSFGQFIFKGYVTSLNISPVENASLKNGKYSAYNISVQMTSVYNGRSPNASNAGSFYDFDKF